MRAISFGQHGSRVPGACLNGCSKAALSFDLGALATRYVVLKSGTCHVAGFVYTPRVSFLHITAVTCYCTGTHARERAQGVQLYSCTKDLKGGLSSSHVKTFASCDHDRTRWTWNMCVVWPQLQPTSLPPRLYFAVAAACAMCSQDAKFRHKELHTCATRRRCCSSLCVVRMHVGAQAESPCG